MENDWVSEPSWFDTAEVISCSYNIVIMKLSKKLTAATFIILILPLAIFSCSDIVSKPQWLINAGKFETIVVREDAVMQNRVRFTPVKVLNAKLQREKHTTGFDFKPIPDPNSEFYYIEVSNDTNKCFELICKVRYERQEGGNSASKEEQLKWDVFPNGCGYIPCSGESDKYIKLVSVETHEPGSRLSQ